MILRVVIKPNQRFDKIESRGEDIVIRLAAPATEGKANQRLIQFLSTALDLPKSKIILEKGNTSRFKRLNIDADTEFVLQKIRKGSQT